MARIAAAINEAKLELSRLDKKKQPGKVKTGRVYAAKGWEPALEVKAGQVLRITASGKWAVSDRQEHRSGPDGCDVEYGGYRYGTLIARVGDAKFAVGTEAEIEVPADGTLELVCHHADGGGDRDNNSGFVEVRIKVREPPPVVDADETAEDEAAEGE